MVAKGTKRKVNESEAAAEKCSELATAITNAADLPSDVIEMLVDVLPHSLGQPKDKRHRFQEQTILSVDRVMQGIEESLKKNIEEARGKLLEARRRAAPSESAVTEAEEKLRQDTDRFGHETKALAKSAQEFRTARTAVEKSQEAQVKGDQDLEMAADKKDKLQSIVDNLVEPLKNGTVPEADVQNRCKSLMSTLKELEGFDEAMLMVLASSLAKEPSARGDFDHMAIDQLDKYMAKHIAPLVELLRTGETGKQQRAKAVQLAQEALEQALKAQKLSAEAFESTWNAKKDDEQTLGAARQALKDLAASTKSCDKTLYNAEAEFDVFGEFARKPFEELKERWTPAPEPEELEQTNASCGASETTQLEAGAVLPEAITA